MSEPVGIETRSRSRSKTPGLLSQENGDSSDRRGSKKIPTVSLIEEEVEVLSQPSQKPKSKRRSAKNTQSDTSNDNSQETASAAVAVVSNKKQSKTTVTTTTTTTVLTTKQIINGSEEKNEESSTKTTTIATNGNGNDAQEIPESQSIFNNIFNAIKTSTPILSSKRTKRVSHEIKTTPDVDYKLHPAYKEYKDAGEYWNKYPKTDYTYSELSPHRRELGAGIVAMPNMSRKSLDKYQHRVEDMIRQNPTEESFIRRKFLNNMSYQKKAMDLQYDSADEVDVSILHEKLSARRYSQKNFIYRFFAFIVGVFSSAYSNVKQKIWYGSKHQRLSYTPMKRHNQQGFLRRAYTSAQKFFLLCISKVYLLISTILCLDTWLLYTRSQNVQENQKRKRFLLGLIFLLPLLLFGVWLLSDDYYSTFDPTTLFTHININPLEQIHHKVEHVSQYLSTLSAPTIPSLPQINFNFGWLLTPFFWLGAMLTDLMKSSPSSSEHLKMALDEERFQLLLKHIDSYVDSTLEQKLLTANSALMKDVNERLIVIIGSHVSDSLKQYQYQLTAKDMDVIVYQIKVQLNDDFNEREKLMLAKMSLASDENIQKIILMTGGARDVQFENQNIDLDKMILMILESNKITEFLEHHLKSINSNLDIHGAEILGLKKELGEIRAEILGKFSDYDERMAVLAAKGASISDDLIRFKKDNDEAIRSILMRMDEKFAAFSDFTSIDLSVRKSLVNILGLNSNPDMTDEALLKQWIENTFVAKTYLEEHLKNMELKLNEALLMTLDKNAGKLMEEINERLKSQIKLSVEENIKLGIKGGASMSEADVIKIVKEILAIYDADKTGLVDYALESAGGEVISTRCTENYRAKSAEISIFGIPIWYPNNTPRTVISPTIAPGECWAFQGFPGYLVIKLNNLIRVTGFTIEHIPQANAPNRVIDSAPNNFSVWGLTSEFDKNPVLFGNYFYSAAKDAPSLQYFPVKNKEIIQPYQIVELVIESNHGNVKYTCLYRFRVHGEME